MGKFFSSLAILWFISGTLGQTCAQSTEESTQTTADQWTTWQTTTEQSTTEESTLSTADQSTQSTTEPSGGGDRGSCEDGWVHLENKCLKLRLVGEAFQTAFNICRRDYGASLLTIESQNQQEVLERLFVETGVGNRSATNVAFLYTAGVRCPQTTGFHWLGSSQQEIPIQFKNYDVNQPADGATCLLFNLGAKYSSTHNYGRWHGGACLSRYPFVCQKLARI